MKWRQNKVRLVSFNQGQIVQNFFAVNPNKLDRFSVTGTSAQSNICR